MKRRHEEEHDNKERWLVSYADFITLLFAFFVVMYSISSVNEGKYKVLSESLEGVFNTKEKTLSPIQVGDYVPLAEEEPHGRTRINPIMDRPEPVAKEEPKDPDEDLQLEEIAGEFRESFEDLIFEEHLTVEQKEDWIEISLNESVVFQSGGSEPLDEALVIIEKIAGIMSDRDNAILIEGHTDNVPIRGSVFPSNWELSAARAASVVRYLALEGVTPSQMGAVGFGEFKPIARNDTPRGRLKNRRVVILVSKKNDIHETFLN
jgi:chemotaxis protein MotB